MGTDDHARDSLERMVIFCIEKNRAPTRSPGGRGAGGKTARTHTHDKMTATQLDLTTPEGVKALMASSKGEDEWNNNCDKVKAANNGYPAFWYPTIILGGVLNETRRNW